MCILALLRWRTADPELYSHVESRLFTGTRLMFITTPRELTYIIRYLCRDDEKEGSDGTEQ